MLLVGFSGTRAYVWRLSRHVFLDVVLQNRTTFRSLVVACVSHVRAAQEDSSALDRHLGSLSEGDTVELQGPHELLRYKPNAYRTIGMIAGSTGIAPLIQVIHEAMFSAVDYTEIKVCISTLPLCVL